MCSRWKAAYFGLAALGGAWTCTALAEPIVYQEQAVASGSLGGLDFTNALVVIRVTADTSGVIGTPFGLFTNSGAASVSIGAIAQASFVDQLQIFAYLGAAGTELGIADPGPAADLLDTGLAAGFNYELAGALAPATGPSLINPFFPFATSGGDLDLVSAGDATFSASLQDVPEPPSSLLFPGAASLLLALRFARRKAVTAP